jgi:predicted DNA-binding protein
MATMKGRREMTSIYLRPEVLNALRTFSAGTDIPVAHYLREAVDDLLAKYKVKVAKPKAKKS